MDKNLIIGLSVGGAVLLVNLVLVVLGVANVIPFGKPSSSSSAGSSAVSPPPPAPPATAKITGLPWNAYLTCDALCNSPASITALQKNNAGAAALQGLPASFLQNNLGARSADGNDNYWAQPDSSCSCVADNSAPWESLAYQPAVVTVAPFTNSGGGYAGNGTCEASCSNAVTAAFASNSPGFLSVANGAKPAGGSPLPSTARLLNANPTCTCVPSTAAADAFPTPPPVRFLPTTDGRPAGWTAA